jgi:hypothetical protein
MAARVTNQRSGCFVGFLWIVGTQKKKHLGLTVDRSRVAGATMSRGTGSLTFVSGWSIRNVFYGCWSLEGWRGRERQLEL